MPYANTQHQHSDDSQAEGQDLAADVDPGRIETPTHQGTGEPAAGEAILQFFVFDHLPPALQEVSKPFGDLAHFIVDAVPRNAERLVALRKILEAKDAAVRALLAK